MNDLMKKLGESYQIKIKFESDLLGTVGKNPKVYEAYVAGKAKPALTETQLEEELSTLPEIEEKGWTGFHQEEGNPFFYNYWVSGLFTSACQMMRHVPKSESKKLTNFKSYIKGMIFAEPRRIKIIRPDTAKEMTCLERPLRGMTAQGPRITLTRSDICEIGSTSEFTIRVFPGKITEKMIREWLDYGFYKGFGQWRNGGYGRISYEMTSLK